MITFAQVRELIEAGDLTRLVELLRDADETARRGLASDLRAYELDHVPAPEMGLLAPNADPMAGYGEYLARQEVYQRRADHRETALFLAGLACLPRATDLVAWVRSDKFWNSPAREAIGIAVKLLMLPGRPSAEAVARGLATRLRPAQVDEFWPLTSVLLAATKVKPEPTEAVLRGWIRDFRMAPIGLAGALRRHRWTNDLLPHVFTVPRVGADLHDEWPGAIAALAGDGPERRGEVLTGCLLRLRSGDRPGAIKPFVALHRLLATSLDEDAKHRNEYTGMLASSHVTVAELALTALRRLDDAGRLDSESRAEAARAVLPRPEKKLVRAQLAWIRAALARNPAPELYEALATGLANPSVDLAEQCLKLLAAHPEGRAALAGATAWLEGDLRRQADAALGSAPEAPAKFAATRAAASLPAATAATAATAARLPGPPPAVPMPPPIASPAELIGVVTQHLRQRPDQAVEERILAYLATGSPGDVLAPLLWSGECDPFLGVLNTASAIPSDRLGPEFYDDAIPLFWMTANREWELAERLEAGIRTPLLATPATTDGQVDPVRVLSLLAAAESEGWQPGRFDLTQALLRLPRRLDDAVRAAADRLTSPAGRTFAAYVTRGGLPDPVMTTASIQRRPCTHVGPGDDPFGAYRCWCLSDPVVRRVARFAAPDHGLPGVPDGLLASPTGDREYHVAFYTQRHAHDEPGRPMVLPGHPEIVAAHALPSFAHAADGTVAQNLDILRELAAAPGPVGRAVALCAAYGLQAGRPSGRTVTVEAFLILAGRGDFDPGLVGEEMAALFTDGGLVLGRVARSLGDAVAAGAGAAVWAVVRTLVPAVLADPRPGAGAPDLLAVAASAAAATGARDHLPGLAETAGRRGAGRLRTEAARLGRILAA